MDTSKVTRVEVIDVNGRAYVRSHRAPPASVSLSLQDDGRTLKVFVLPQSSMEPLVAALKHHEHDVSMSARTCSETWE